MSQNHQSGANSSLMLLCGPQWFRVGTRGLASTHDTNNTRLLDQLYLYCGSQCHQFELASLLGVRQSGSTSTTQAPCLVAWGLYVILTPYDRAQDVLSTARFPAVTQVALRKFPQNIAFQIHTHQHMNSPVVTVTLLGACPEHTIQSPHSVTAHGYNILDTLITSNYIDPLHITSGFRTTQEWKPLSSYVTATCNFCSVKKSNTAPFTPSGWTLPSPQTDQSCHFVMAIASAASWKLWPAIKRPGLIFGW